MQTLRKIQSNTVLLAVPICLAMLLLTLLLLPAWAPVRGQEGLELPSANASQGSENVSTVITVGVGTWLFDPGPGWGWGWAEANSVQLAISETNAAGGIDIGGITYTLALVTVDDLCDPAQVITATHTLLAAGAVAVVGHGCSGMSLAAQPIYNAAGVAMVSPSASRPLVTQLGYPNTFRTISHDGTDPAMLAAYFRNELGLSTSSIVSGPDRPWNYELGDIYNNTFSSLGGTITSRREVTGTSQFTATLTAILAEHPDAIYYLDNDPTRSGQFSLIAYSLGMTDTVMGWSAWQNYAQALADYESAAGAAAAEGDYAAMQYRRFEDMPGWTAYLSAYQAAGFPNEPDDPGDFGAFAYDAAHIIINAIDQADSTDPLTIRRQIAAMSNYAGVVGTYQAFNACGDVIPQMAWLEQYQAGQWNILPYSPPASPCVLRVLVPLALRSP
jgi:branched-chain amino acid transport system substrate-binding protein